MPRYKWAGRQAAAELGDGRVFARQLLLDRQRRTELGHRLTGLGRETTAARPSSD